MKPTVPQGTRDFDAITVRKRNYIFNTIQHIFELYGFQPLETPAMENITTLMGKYGDEGDKLIFKILNNGLDNPGKASAIGEAFAHVMNGKTSTVITERALRYDLTIPFARYVAMNYNQLTMPFKRYQIQPVWRADRPQKGRYREFYQCDADVVGSKSLLNELDLANMYATAFSRLQIPVEIHINNRKILSALALLCGSHEKLIDITTAIDKLDKIGIDKVKAELSNRGLQQNQINKIETFLAIQGNNAQKLQQVKDLLGDDPMAIEGLGELDYLITHFTNEYQDVELVFDLTLARGLNYYTGIIFEVKAVGVQIGSIGGGGRYDDLTGLFGVPNVPGVGISFGIDRIYDVLTELNRFPADLQVATKLLFFNLGEKETEKAVILANALRGQNIACEVYHEQVKFDKQFKYAEKKGIPYIAILGSRELENGIIIIKQLTTGHQLEVSFDELVNFEFK